MSTGIPKIAISSIPRPVETGYGADEADTVAKGAIAGIVAAGAVPLILPVVDPALAAAQLDAVDGLILSGGHDLALDPGADTPLTAERWIDPARDVHEVALWRAARDAGLPVLGICRGAQLVNHVEGGSLISHVEGHDAGGSHAADLHDVAVVPDSELARVCGSAEIAVNTIHHQAIREPGRGLIACASARDGLIEAVESEAGRPWFLGVQWHPELMLDSPGGQPLFDAIAAAARSGPADR